MTTKVQELGSILADKRKYMETFMSIPDKKSQTVPFLLNALQVVLLDALEKYHRVIIVKARQMGCSTLIIGDFLAHCETNKNIVAGIISHEDFATQQLLKKAKFMEASLPSQIKSTLGHSSSYELTWPDIHSSFYIGSARASVIGRGDTFHRLHLSELAFYPMGKGDGSKPEEGKTGELYKGATESVPSDGVLVVESTPNGRVGLFYNLYQQAKAGESNLYPLFFPWWWDPEYSEPYGSMVVAEKFRFHVEPNEEESDLMSEHGLTIDQIRWRRGKKAELGLLFKQEYPENDVECWLVKGIAALPTESLLAMASRIRTPFFEAEGVKKWRSHRGGSKYIVVVDAAKGSPTSDPSVAIVLETKDCTHVATLRGKFPVDIMAQRTASLAEQYGSPPIVVEREGYGTAVIKFLEQLGYERIYKYTDGQKGFPMSFKTRPYVLEQLGSGIRTNTLTSWDGDFINEALDFQYIDGKAQAPSGGHDDLVMAMGIGMTVRTFPGFAQSGPQRRSQSYVPAGVL